MMNESRLKCFSDGELFAFQYALIRANPGFYGMFPPKETPYTKTAKKLLDEIRNEITKRDEEEQ